MRQRYIILLLCIGVIGFSIHNIYQSSNISDLRWNQDKAFVHQMAPRAEIDRMAIEVIAGGIINNASHLLFEELSFQPDQLPFSNGKQHPEAIQLDGRNLFPELSLDDCQVAPGRPVYKTVNGTKIAVPLWQQKLDKCQSLGHSVNGTWKYVLAEVLQVRIYPADRAKWTIRELKQWMHFMFLAGVEHIFICDHYQDDSERLEEALRRYTARRLVTYMPWGDLRNPMQAQIRCYQRVIDAYRAYTTWQMAVDMDEYPYSPTDGAERFLVRYLSNVTSRYGTRISEISMDNFLMLGQGNRTRDMVIDRIDRMTPRPANRLTKPIYRPERVRANVHHNRILYGAHLHADADELRMLHYWGARVQDWGPDTNRTLAITNRMSGMRRVWAERVRHSLLAFGEYDAFCSQTGP